MQKKKHKQGVLKTVEISIETVRPVCLHVVGVLLSQGQSSSSSQNSDVVVHVTDLTLTN